jgi:hypothetical protein
VAKKTLGRKFEFTSADIALAKGGADGTGATIGVEITLLVLTPDVKKLPRDFVQLAHGLLYEDAAMKQRK